jgi:Rrf2 family nitric oxide-sensitive transcriptional repressor
MITKKTEYAIRTLSELAQNPDDRLTANVVAQRQGIPPKYLPQIVAELCQAGLLRSVRGYGGGIRLNSPASEITLLTIIEAMQGKPKLFDCQISDVECTNCTKCDLQLIYDRALTALEDVFRGTVLSDITVKRRTRGRNGK